MFSKSTDRFDPLAVARICGIASLAGILTGGFSIGYVQNAIVVAGNAPATLHNLLAHATLFRWGFSSHLLELLLNIVGEILFYFLIRRVNAIVASIALLCAAVGIAIESVELICACVPFSLAVEGATQGAFNVGQVSALSHLAGQLDQACLLLSWVFYGVDEFLSGILIFRSKFLPRPLGILLGIAGLSYFTHGLLSFLSPALDGHLSPYVAYLCFPGEFSISLWMAVVGLNVAKWRAWTLEAKSELVFA